MTDNLMIITSSGGGGLLQSAIAIEQEQRQLDPNVNIIKKDLLMEWTGVLIGLFGKFFYNWTQRAGKVLLTNIFVNMNMYAEIVFNPLVFFGMLFNLFRYDIEKVIDNQPLSTKSIIRAIRFYNWYTGKNIILEKVFVDLPTREYRQLLKSIKNLSPKDKRFIKIFTIEPLLDDEKTNEEYWQKNCKISEEQIVYKKYIIRQNFKKFQGIEKPKSDFDLKTKFASLEERDFIKKCLEKGHLKPKENENEFIFTLSPQDKLFIILLGSQPSSNAVFNYVKGITQKIRDSDSRDKKYSLIVFADKFSTVKQTMFHKIHSLINTIENYPSNLSIVPMSFQNDEVISALFHRGDLTITRSGGHTIMELMAVSKGNKWIHSETKRNHVKEVPSYEKLLKGIPCWELGNARYLHDKFNGDIVTPEIIYQKLEGIV